MASHCRRSSRQVPPNLCRRMAARPHADPRAPTRQTAGPRRPFPVFGRVMDRLVAAILRAVPGGVWRLAGWAEMDKMLADGAAHALTAATARCATPTGPGLWRGRQRRSAQARRRAIDPGLASGASRSSKTHGYPCQRRTAGNPSVPQADGATRADGHLRQAAGGNSKARLMAAVCAEGLGIPALARSPWACTPGTGASATGQRAARAVVTRRDLRLWASRPSRLDKEESVRAAPAEVRELPEPAAAEPAAWGKALTTR